MSTNSTVGVVNPDGTFTTIYVHCDGGPDDLGKTLQEFYATEERARALIALGDCFAVGQHVSRGDGTHGTIVYHRDLKEAWEDVEPRITGRIEDLCDTAYTYLFGLDGYAGWSMGTYNGSWVRLAAPSKVTATTLEELADQLAPFEPKTGGLMGPIDSPYAMSGQLGVTTMPPSGARVPVASMIAALGPDAPQPGERWTHRGTQDTYKVWRIALSQNRDRVHDNVLKVVYQNELGEAFERPVPEFLSTFERTP